MVQTRSRAAVPKVPRRKHHGSGGNQCQTLREHLERIAAGNSEEAAVLQRFEQDRDWQTASTLVGKAREKSQEWRRRLPPPPGSVFPF